MSRRSARLAERHTLRIVHDIPGRLRMRLPPASRTEGLAETIRRTRGIVECAWAPRTRSVLVRYQPGATTPDVILDAVVRHAGLDETMVGERRDPRPELPPPRALVVTAVNNLFGELNERMRRATRQTLSLNSAIPLALTAWATIEVLRGRAAPLVWSSALWYAHGLFRDYNTPSPDWGE